MVTSPSGVLSVFAYSSGGAEALLNRAGLPLNSLAILYPCSSASSREPRETEKEKESYRDRAHSAF